MAGKRVDLYIPRAGSHEDPNLFISVNGKNYLLPRGKTSNVPEEVAAEYNRSVKAQEAQDAAVDAMKN